MIFYLENMVFFMMMVLFALYNTSSVTHWTVSAWATRLFRRITGSQWATGWYRAMKFATGTPNRSEFHRQLSTRGVNFLSRMTKMESPDATGHSDSVAGSVGRLKTLLEGAFGVSKRYFQALLERVKRTTSTDWFVFSLRANQTVKDWWISIVYTIGRQRKDNDNT